MSDVFIIGSGMIRFSKYPDETVKSMAEKVIDLALKDANLRKEDIQAGFFSNTFWGMYERQHSIRGQVIFRGMGIDKIPVTNVENACAGASTSMHLAWTGIKSGLYDVAIAVGSEKITHPEKAVALGAYASCMDIGNLPNHLKMIEGLNKTLKIQIPEDGSKPGEGRSIFMDAYAMGARWHMDRFGSTQRQLAVICSKNHMHGFLNPYSQYQERMSVEEVLAEKLVAWPLTRPMCAPLGDGAAAVVLCSEQYLKKLIGARPVRIRASVLGQGSERSVDDTPDIGERLAKQAYDIAGVGPDDISLAELHDATSWGELHQCESMGFCPPGEGGPYAESGATTLGGKKPVNTSGGLECRGHPIGASGLAQIHELVLQLRNDAGQRQVEGARLGLAENGGGNIGVEEAAMCIHILEKV